MLKQGRYFVGDPCYVLTEENGFDWDDVLDKTRFFNLYPHKKGNRDPNNTNPKHEQHGEFDYKGMNLCVSSTAWGDGGFSDQFGNGYSVDSGCIGAVPLESIPHSDYEWLKDLGHVHEFKEDFTISYIDGKITIGDIVIDTN